MEVISLVSRDPTELSKKELIKVARLHKDLVALCKDPWNNPNHIHPETPELKSRILANPVLRRYYRPDLFSKGIVEEVTKDTLSQEYRRCVQDLDSDVLHRTAYHIGVSWRGKHFMELVDHVCVALFCHLTKADIPYDGNPRSEATAWLQK